MKKLNKQTELKRQFHHVLLCSFVADPATFLASNRVPQTLFSSPCSVMGKLICLCLFQYFINIVNVKVLSVNVLSKTTKCPFG